MQARSAFWFSRATWVGALLLAVAMISLYAWLPVDGATGDLESFHPLGFRVKWLLEAREDGLQREDIIVRAGGHTVDEWLSGAPRGPEWREGGVVSYEILRDGLPDTLSIQLAPVSFGALLARWAPQFIVGLALLTLGTFVFTQRPRELSACLLMFFSVAMALQYLGDAYNIQYATLPWRWPFWFHLAYEQGVYALSVATICYFALIFPAPHPWIKRYPRLVPLLLYLSFPASILGAMALSPTWTGALRNGDYVGWFVAIVQFMIAIAAGIRSARHARDPITRAQIRWIVWCGCIGVGVLVPGYVLPLLLTGQPLLPHPVLMLVIALIPFTFAIAILRYRLFDIEVIINRTLVYGSLTALLIGLYLLLVWLLTLLIGTFSSGTNDTLVVFIATLSIALAFAPLRRRVQAVIDRTFYRTKLDYQRMLPEMSERLATSLVLEELSALLTGELPKRLQIAWAALAVLDQEGTSYVPTDHEAPLPTLPVGHPLVDYLRRMEKPLMRLQPPSRLPSVVLEFLTRYGVELSIPLIVRGRLVGLYYLGPRLSGDAYGREQMRLLHLMSQQAAVAVENSRLFQATERQAEELAGLHEAAVAISSSLEVKEVLCTLAEHLGQALDVGSVYIYDLDERSYQTTVLAEWIKPDNGGPGSDLGATYDLRQYPSTLERLLAKEPLAIQATDLNLDPADRASAQKHGWHSILVAPLVIRDRVIGYAELWEMQQGRQFTADEVRLCQTVAADAAAAIEHARLYEQAQQEISERKLAEERIKASLEEKEVLLKEIHHRVKNNLQVISSLLYLQSRRVHDEATIHMFQESRHRVRSMALVHERLYRAQDLARVDFAEYVRSLVKYLHRTYDVSSELVTLNVSVDDVTLGIDTAVPCGLILNELVSNSLKHAFQDKAGEIEVGFHRGPDDRFVLTVSDNGIGIPEDQEVWSNGSLGLQLVHTLVNQLEATLELDKSQGTRFQITFSDPQSRGRQA